MTVISATQEAEVGGSWSETSMRKSMRPYLKKEIRHGSSGRTFS
jgi:hypothetical protein